MESRSLDGGMIAPNTDELSKAQKIDVGHKPATSGGTKGKRVTKIILLEKSD